MTKTKNKYRIGLLLVIISLLILAFKTADDNFEISKNIEIFTSVYKEVNLQYVDETRSGELMRKSIDAMLGSLDPYTVFYSEAQAEEALTQHTGEYGGLGVAVEVIDNYIVLIDIFDGYAAQKAGLKIGDKLIASGIKSLIGKTIEELSPIMKGAAGTSLSLTIERPGKGQFIKTLTREEIKVKNVPYYGKAKNNVGYIYLANFMQDASKEVQIALANLRKEGCTSFILDLRNNPGGFLMEAVNIVNLFIPKNELVVYTRGRYENNIVNYNTTFNPVEPTAPLVILINGRSASASEIVSGTLQDLDRAVVLGENSFGKGLVQNTKNLPYRTQIKITTAKYYTPSGRCIQSLDYSHRNADGTVGKVADSLRTAFKTKKGRTVYDGGGIKPDKPLPANTAHDLLKLLETKNILFEFSVNYVNKLAESEIIDETFNLPTKAMEDFYSFVNLNINKIQTPVDAQILTLKNSFINSTENTANLKALADLQSNIAVQKIMQIKKEQALISQRLSLEIIRIYGLQPLFNKAQFSKDELVVDAIKTLESADLYQQILK